MPNWCENRVQLSDDGDNSEQFDKLCKLLDGPNPFNAIFPRPDFPNIPNEKGELPIKEVHKNDKGEVVAETYNFPDGKNDDRWYHWCVENWGTKWEPDMHGLDVSDYDSLEISFNTAWSPPEGVVEKLREKFPDLSFQCFFDEPGCEVAGYY